MPIGSQADVESPRNKTETPLLLTKTQSIRGEVVGEACSPLIPKTVDGLSTRFHGKIVALVLEVVRGNLGAAWSWILQRVEGSWPWMMSYVHMKAIKERGTMRGQCVGIFFAGIAFGQSPVGARFAPPQQLSAP